MKYRLAYFALASAVTLSTQLYAPRATAAWAQADPFDTARYYIVGKENAEALKLVDSGQFPIGQANYEGWTWLHYAAESNNLDMVKALLQRGADPMAKTKYGTRPIDAASATMVKAALGAAMKAKTGADPMAPAKPVAAASSRSSRPATSRTKASAPQSARAKLCQSRWYSSQALCSDSTCKMREYRKWQSCLKTGSYY